METNEIFMIAVVLAVIGADILLRLYWNPARRDGSLEHLLDTLHHGEPAAVFYSGDTAGEPLQPLTHSLVRHFGQSFASRQIVAALASAPRGMTEEDLARQLNGRAAKGPSRAVPSNAVRKVIAILKGAEFVRMEDETVRITELGSALHHLLESKERG